MRRWRRAADVVEQRDLVNQGTVGIISGGIAGTYVRIAADLADAFDRGYDMRVLPVIGKGSVRNIEDLLLLRGIDIAIVQSDVLEFYKRADLFPGIEDKIAYITKLYEEEVHLLARAEIASVDELRGRQGQFRHRGQRHLHDRGHHLRRARRRGRGDHAARARGARQPARRRHRGLVFVGGQPLNLVSQIESGVGPAPAADPARADRRPPTSRRR